MLVSYEWLKEYLVDIPPIEKLAEILTTHSYEVEKINGDILDIDVLPNRTSDSLSHIGVAREIGILCDLELKFPEIKVKTTDTKDYVTLKIENFKYCRRAMKRLVINTKVKESPEWLKEKLKKFDQKPINNIVDATNYVTFETGQPVHAFDYDKIEKNISIQFAKKTERITTLDGVTLDLDDEVLVIHDGKKPLDIAGIKGGIDSSIDENTSKVLLSVCNFDPTTIRKTSQKLRINTEASKRFEADISPELASEAMERLSQLVTELTGGEASEEILDVYPKKRDPRNPKKVGVSLGDVNKLLGLNIEEKELEKILKKLNFKFKKVKPLGEIKTLIEDIKGKPYKYGASVSYDAPDFFDCSSLTSWLYVQGGISIPRVSIDQYIYGEPIEEKDLKFGDLIFSNNGEGTQNTIKYETVDFARGSEVKEGLNHVGMYLEDNKVLHSTDTGGVIFEKLKESEKFKKIVGYRRITNLSAQAGNEERYVIEIPHYRLDLNIKEDLIEEVGRMYGYENIKESKKAIKKENKKTKKNKEFYYINKIKDWFIENGFSEIYNYAFGNDGEVEMENPIASDKKFLRSNLSDKLKESLEFNNRNKDLLALDKIKIFEIGKVYKKDGEYYEVVCSDESIKEVEDIKLGEKIDFSSLPDVSSYDFVQEDKNTQFRPISPYPFVLRDIAVWVPKEVKSDEILDIIKKESEDLLVQNKLFDEYQKDDKISYAFHLVFQSQEKTLTDEEIGGIMKKIESQITQNNWQVR